jgi:hypothetical protein
MTNWVKHVACMGKLRNVYNFLMVKPARKDTIQKTHSIQTEGQRLFAQVAPL